MTKLNRPRYALTVLALMGIAVGLVWAFGGGRSFGAGVALLAALGGILWAAAGRLGDAGREPLWAILVVVPGVGFLVLVVLGFLPSKHAPSGPA